MPKILVLYYSSYGHIEIMARAKAEGAARAPGAQVSVKRVPELTPPDVCAAAGYHLDQPAPIAEPEELADYDAIVFGTPTRFGNHHLLSHHPAPSRHDHCRPALFIQGPLDHEGGDGRHALRRFLRHRRRRGITHAHEFGTRRHTTRKIKISVPGTFTMAQQAQIDYYGGSRELAAMDYAVAVNEEIRDLFSAGADVVQIDESYMQARPDEARAWGQKALNRALDGVGGVTAVHICFGYAAIIHTRPSGYSFLPELQACSCNQISVETAQSNLDCSALTALAGKTIMLGVIDLSDMPVETPDTVAARIRRALPFVKARDLIVCTDCGMKYLPRDVAFAKMQVMVQGAAIVRAESQPAAAT